MPQQQPNDGWAPVAGPSDGWEPVGVSPSDEGYTAAVAPYGNPPPPLLPDTITGGALRRAKGNIQGIYHTVTDPPTGAAETAAASATPGGLQMYRTGKAFVEGEKQAAGQVKEQVKAAGEVKGDPVEKGLAYAKAGVTAASMADPFATGPVSNVNTLEAEGRSKEAIGAGAFDALSLLAGGRTGREVSPETRLNKLTFATDAQSVRPLTHIMPDIEETVKQVGKPQTVGQLETVIQGTMDRFEQRFNAGLTTAKGTVNTTPIADALEAKARTLPRTASAEAATLRKAAIPYQEQDWTPQELNAERMYRNGLTKGFQGKSGTAQMAAMRSNADTMVDEIVAEHSRDVLYDELERQHPGQGFRELKRKESSILEMQDHFRDHVKKLESAQAKKSGAPFREKINVSTSMHTGSVTPRLHRLGNLVPGGGPLKAANKATSSAFGPTTAAAGRRAAILALPVTSITQGRAPTVPPVPTGEQDQGPE